MRFAKWLVVAGLVAFVFCEKSTDPDETGTGGDTTPVTVFVRVYYCLNYQPCIVAPDNCVCPDYRGSDCQSILDAYTTPAGHPAGMYYVCNTSGSVLDSNSIGQTAEVTVPNRSKVIVKMLTTAAGGGIDTLRDTIVALDSLRWDFFRDTWSTTGVPGPCDTANIW